MGRRRELRAVVSVALVALVSVLLVACKPKPPPPPPPVPPVASFTTTPATGNVPLEVKFVDTSAGTVTARSWDFGDGSSAVAKKPRHVFTRPGTYTVTLTVSGVAGSDSATRTIDVLVPPPTDPVVAAFAATPLSGDAPLTVSFTDQSAGLIRGWSWSFGDGSGSSERSPSHTYTTPGTYDAVLTVGGAGTSTASRRITVAAPPTQNRAPTVGIDGPPDGTTVVFGSSVRFAGSAADDEDGDLSTRIVWTSDLDGELGRGGDVETAILSVGTHTITASVTDMGGKTASATIAFTVAPPPENRAPTVQIDGPPDGTTVAYNTTVRFAGSAADDEDGDLSTRMVWTSDLDGDLGRGGDVETAILRVGTHTITASVTDSGGKTAMAQIGLTISPPPENHEPTVRIDGPPDGTSVRSGIEVQLDGSASDDEEGDLSFGIVWRSSRDGLLGTGAQVKRSDLSAGAHTITATVTDTGGKTATATITLTVLPPPENAAPTVQIGAPPDDQTVSFGAEVGFSASASDDEDGDMTTSIVWRSSLDGPLGSGATVTTSSLSPGVHIITASVTDMGGNTATATITLTVLPPPPTAAFAANPTSGDAPLTVGFTDQSTGVISTYAWSFGDGGQSSDASPSHQYATPGRYDVALTVTGPGGISAADTFITVNTPPPNRPPVVTMTAPANNGIFESGSEVSFSASASDPDEGDLSASIVWTSDRDGELGTGASFEKSLSDGAHVVTATVTDSKGETVRASATILINALPVVTITAPAEGSSHAPGRSVTFSASTFDAEDGDLSSFIVWSENGQQVGAGPSISLATLEPGSHTLVASITDSANVRASASVTITIESPPVVTITAPADGASVSTGAPVTLTATAIDAEEGDISASIVWRSTLGGELGAGASLTTTLIAGRQTIRADVTDSSGANGTASIIVTADVPPTVTITAPADFAAFAPGTEVAFTATAPDTEEGDLSSAVAWSSDIDGALGSGASIRASLSDGQHTVTATVRDSAGGVSTTSVRVKMDATPVVTVTPPADGTTVVLGDAVSLTATATDAEEGDLTARLTWRSDLDGVLGTGGTVTATLTTVGPHTITAAATDLLGVTGSASITLLVNRPPTVSITSPANQVVVSPGDSVTFSGTANDAENGDLSAGIVWQSDLDGEIGRGATFATSTLTAGTHVITAEIADAAGTTRLATVILHVGTPPAPVASFTQSATGGEAPVTIRFTDTSTGYVTSWFWDFGDGFTSTEQHPTHTFWVWQPNFVQLTVRGPGGENTFSSYVTVTAPPAPDASFTADPTSGPAPLTVSFTDTSTGVVYPQEPLLGPQVWVFGDGTTSNEQHPTHTYRTPGTYTVTFRRYGPGGGDEATGTITVTAP